MDRYNLGGMAKPAGHKKNGGATVRGLAVLRLGKECLIKQ